MKFGLFGIGSGPCAEPEVAKAVAQAAELAGYDSLWTGEHVVLPDPQAPPSPAPPEAAMLHPSTILAYLAGVTSTIKLGTGIVLIAQRNPVVLAKEIASLDVLTQGRLLFGIGAGYLKAEFDALGVEFTERGARTDEYIEVLRILWRSDKPEFAGKFARFSGIQSRPRPVQEGGPPLVLGGASEAAFRRAVQQCQGWYGFALDLDSTATCIAGLQEAARRYERPAELGELEISVTPRHRVTPEQVSQYEDAGVSRLILLQRSSNQKDLIEYLNTTAEQLM